jgi:gluconate kinase
VTGILSAGKTTASREIAHRSSFRYFDGDGQVSRARVRSLLVSPQVPNAEKIRLANEMFDELLDAVARNLTSANVVLDLILSEDRVRQIRARFEDPMMVLLRVSEGEWRRREVKRGKGKDSGRSMDDRTGPTRAYDLVVDTDGKPPQEIADRVLAKARNRWGEDATS